MGGEKSTFFYKFLKNSILELILDMGKTFPKTKALKSKFWMFSASSVLEIATYDSSALKLATYFISCEKRGLLKRPWKESETGLALNSMSGAKAPGRMVFEQNF